MRDWSDRLVDAAGIGLTEPRLKGTLAALTEHLGFERYAFLHIAPIQSFALSNYELSWQDLYFERKYHYVDPIVLRAKSRMSAFLWSRDDARSNLSDEQLDFFNHASDFGINSGMTIPVRTPNGFLSMFTLASAKRCVRVGNDIDPVAAAAAVGQLHARISLLQVEPTAENEIDLDPKAATYLRWAAVGKSMSEIADIEGVKYNSVKVKIADTKKRFNVYTTAHLLAVVIRRGLI